MYNYTLLEKLVSSDDLKKFSFSELNDLAEEVRLRTIEIVRENGGHLGPNLGTVEIIIAAHYVFNFTEDKFVFDVGHQSYPHKIITGRHKAFSTLRQKNGLSGYPNQHESSYDVFRSGHASTAISTSLGLVKGYNLSKEQQHKKVLALVGDGSMTGGMAFEGLNHAGHIPNDLIVVLNDNEMSISPTVGALSRTLNSIQNKKFYTQMQIGFLKILEKVPKIGKNMGDVIQYLMDESKNLINPHQIFTNLGFNYSGPINGHNIKELVEALKNAKDHRGPMLIHVLTQKGKGYRTEKNSQQTLGPHALSPGQRKKEETKVPYLITKKPPTYSSVFSKSIVQIASENKDVVAITAAMEEGTQLTNFANMYADRYFDVGICEAHAVGFSAGIATAGKRPIFAVYSTFLQRGFDQIFHELVLQQNIPVVFCIDRAGLVGEDGPSHHGMYDISYLRLYPSFILMAPKNGKELSLMMHFALTQNAPVAIRYPKGNVPDESLFPHCQPIELGKMEVVVEGNQICLLAYGSMVEVAMEVALNLENKGISVTVVNARFAKPIDEKFLTEMVNKHQCVFTLEEGTLIGGFGSAILQTANLLHLNTNKIKIFALPDRLIEHAQRDEQLRECELDKASIVNRITWHMQKKSSMKEKSSHEQKTH